MKRYLPMFATLMLAMIVVGCGGGGNNANGGSLVGTWSNNNDATITITFNSDGGYIVENNGAPALSGTWSAEGNRVTTIDDGSGPESGTYSISGNTMTYTWSGGASIWTRA